jgi:hypothetical protein
MHMQVLLGNVAAANQQVVSTARELDAMTESLQLTNAQAAEYRQMLIAAVRDGYAQVCLALVVETSSISGCILSTCYVLHTRRCVVNDSGV